MQSDIPIKQITPNSTTRPLPIVEIFGNTIQGEGPRLRPAIFVRTGLCNLKCPGFGCTRTAPNGDTITGCDTIHAVSPKFKETWTEYTDSLQLLQDITVKVYETSALYTEGVLPDIIITGGEPTMHWDNEILQDVLEALIAKGHHITMETNASKLIKFTKPWQRKIQFSMSVKLSVSGEPERKRLNFDAIDNMIQNGNQSYLKFVVNPDTWRTDHTEIQNILTSLPIKPEVYLMALGETIEKQLQNTRFVFDQCAKYGFNFTPRAHILAYNDIEGV